MNRVPSRSPTVKAASDTITSRGLDTPVSSGLVSAWGTALNAAANGASTSASPSGIGAVSKAAPRRSASQPMAATVAP